MSPGEVRFLYLRDLHLYHHEKPFILEDTTSYDKGVITNVEKDSHPVHLTDIRGHEDEYDYESHSFRFIKHTTAIDFLNMPKQDSLAYLKETMTILQQEFDSEHTICYDIRVGTWPSIFCFHLLSDFEAPQQYRGTEGYRICQGHSREYFPGAQTAGPAGVCSSHWQVRLTSSFVCITSNADHTINGGYHRAERHLTDEEIKKYITSGEWRLRIVKCGLLSLQICV